MEQGELPLGFGMALAQDPDALKRFAELTELQRAQMLQKAQEVSTREEMQTLVRGLTSLE